MRKITSISDLAMSWSERLQDKTLEPLVLALAIGGTKVAYALFKVAPTGDIAETVVWSGKLDTQKGKPAFISAFQTVLFEALAFCETQPFRVLPVISAGSPGRFIGEDNRIVAKHSAANLSTFEGEFDNIDLAAEVKASLPEFCEVVIKNDAVAQMAAGVGFLLRDSVQRSLLLGQKIGYIGPGTGLGGGFGQIDDNGHLTVYTDGHIYDIGMTMEDGSIERIEDIFSGRAFEAFTGKTAKEVNENPALFEMHEPLIRKFGIWMADLMMKIYFGRIEKTSADAAWPEADCKLVAGTSCFLIGGSIGTTGKMGQLIRETAMARMSEAGFNDIRLFIIPDAPQAALIGAAQFINSKVLLSWL